MYKQLTSIAIDWLQLHCMRNASNSLWNTDVYDIKKREFGTQFFEDVSYISRKGRLIATACTNPRGSVMRPETCIIKFENDVLYDRNLDWHVKEVLHYNNLTFKGITRLDIACDFNQFSNGMLPEALIYKLNIGEIVKMGRGKGSSHFYIGRVKQDQTLNFGGTDSPISVYMYNKTVEQLERKSKPWIVQQWDAVGLDMTRDVWRLEVSVKGARKKLLNARTGTELDFYSLKIIKEENIKLLWSALVEKYFAFAYERRNEKNKSRLPRLTLFKDMDQHGVVIERTDKIESGLSDKQFINKLTKTFQELRGTADDLAQSAHDVQEWFIHSRAIERQRKLATDKIISGNPNAGNYLIQSDETPNIAPVTPEEWGEYDFTK